MGEKFRSRALKFPGLISGSTMDWFQKWPKEALIEVAQHFLADFKVRNSLSGADLVIGLDYECDMTNLLFRILLGKPFNARLPKALKIIKTTLTPGCMLAGDESATDRDHGHSARQRG